MQFRASRKASSRVGIGIGLDARSASAHQMPCRSRRIAPTRSTKLSARAALSAVFPEAPCCWNCGGPGGAAAGCGPPCAAYDASIRHEERSTCSRSRGTTPQRCCRGAETTRCEQLAGQHGKTALGREKARSTGRRDDMNSTDAKRHPHNAKQSKRAKYQKRLGHREVNRRSKTEREDPAVRRERLPRRHLRRRQALRRALPPRGHHGHRIEVLPIARRARLWSPATLG